MKYEIRSIVCDYAIYEEGNDEPILILNSYANAETIAKILEYDDRTTLDGIASPKVFVYQEIGG